MPLSQLQKREEDSEEVWLPNLIDKYLQRPLNDTFRAMCLATFASDYRYLSTTQPREKRNSHTTDNTANLGNGLGSFNKRAKKSAVIRYPKVRIQYDREKYNFSIMRLYLPFTKTHFRPPEYSTYEDYFLNGMYGDTPVHEIVAKNMKHYKPLAKDIDNLWEQLQSCTNLDNAWADLVPQSELDRLEDATELQTDSVNIEQHENLDIIHNNNSRSTGKNVHTNQLHLAIEKVDKPYSEQAITSMLRTLNKEQKQLSF